MQLVYQLSRNFPKNTFTPVITVFLVVFWLRMLAIHVCTILPQMGCSNAAQYNNVVFPRQRLSLLRPVVAEVVFALTASLAPIETPMAWIEKLD